MKRRSARPQSVRRPGLGLRLGSGAGSTYINEYMLRSRMISVGIAIIKQRGGL